MLKIITFRDPESSILFKTAQKIEVFDAKLKDFSQEMQEILLQNDGLGIAAPQVNKGIALCAVKVDGTVQFFCNPEVISESKKQEKMEEGCFSFPNIFLEIVRAKEIEISYQDLKGKQKKLKARDLLARAIQHEIDHLNGIVFIEKT